jgi:hypothetical protein
MREDTRMRRPAIDMMTAREIAEEYGFHLTDMYAMTGPTNADRDAKLFRLRVETDETWRKIYNPKARYVYPRREVARWYRERKATA